jgi:hypothetical protein
VRFTLGKAFGSPTARPSPPTKGPIELLSPGTTLPDQFVRFTIADPAAGEYAFVVTDPQHGHDKGEFSFDIS